MSVQAMTWALEQRVVTTPSARHVLLCLANYADKNGKAAFPSANSLSEDTGLSVRTIRTALEALREAGVISLGNQAIAAAYIDRHDRRPVVYDLAMQRGAATAPGAERGATAALGSAERGEIDAAAGCNPCTNGVQLTTERGAAAAPNPSFNHPLTINKLKISSAKGSRLAADWTIPADWLEQSAANHPEFDQQALLAIAEDFRDYWTAKTGSQATKLDWHATWRRWMRSQRPHRQQPTRRLVTHGPSAAPEGLVPREDGSYGFA
ncbi:Helix-turn-helix domain-containing protein [Pseudomonas guineae]|uniref:Helix-turn-helix domain-containing protein n=1 Tax=Pseudomonas guineae TaxID=425504 RepID=A0A1I3KCQ7_9PSED|nr:helix-turn-helix domain-containing protein [Pseudomonas guineae]SFI69985.1 Helix-turn-helix domain-containing protein [Pseudomonas guineae]